MIFQVPYFRKLAYTWGCEESPHGCSELRDGTNFGIADPTAAQKPAVTSSHAIFRVPPQTLPSGFIKHSNGKSTSSMIFTAGNLQWSPEAQRSGRSRGADLTKETPRGAHDHAITFLDLKVQYLGIEYIKEMGQSSDDIIYNWGNRDDITIWFIGEN